MPERDPTERIHDIVEALMMQLVDDTETLQVALLASPRGKTAIITVKPAAGDIGKVIGRGGRTAQAIRAIIGAIAERHQMKIELEIDDQRGSDRAQW